MKIVITTKILKSHNSNTSIINNSKSYDWSYVLLIQAFLKLVFNNYD